MVTTAPPRTSTGDDDRPPILPRLGFVGTLRFIWRQLTSMRTALFLLMLLAVGAVPGSVFPQNRIDPSRVQAYITEHPRSSPWLQKLGAFDVYASVWFSAIYLLLFISLVGCVVPRLRQHLKAMRALPPRTPRRLSRMRAHRTMEVHAPADGVLDAAYAVLRRRRYRVVRHDADGTLGASVSAERGYLGETGNLVFHFSLLGLLFVLAAGSFLGYSGQAVVVAGKTWSNTIPLYSQFQAGRWVDTDDLPPFSVTLNAFKATFHETQNQFGEASSFEADVAYRKEPGAAEVKDVIRVNHPLKIDGGRVYLVGNGYAPVFTVKDGEGNVVMDSDPVVFLNRDTMYTSEGAVKIPDAQPEGLGLQGILLPTLGADPTTGQPVSVFPDLRDPRLIFTAFAGDLNMDNGVPQSVYALDFSRLTQLQATGKDGTKGAFSTMLAVGQSVKLPGGAGTVTFDGVQRYAAFNIRHDPTQGWALVFALAALIGLTLSLFVRPRRVWVRATSEGAHTVVEIAGLPKRDSVDLAEETESLMNELTQKTEERARQT